MFIKMNSLFSHFCLLFLFGAGGITSAVINKEISRTIDATNPSVKITAEIKAVEVKGEYQLAFPSNQAEHLSFLSVKHNKKELKISAPVQQ